jgi:PAS domain S-box-containing protein
MEFDLGPDGAPRLLHASETARRLLGEPLGGAALREAVARLLTETPGAEARLQLGETIDATASRPGAEARVLVAVATAASHLETRFRAAMETAPDGFALYDADDRLVYCNSRLRELYPESAAAFVPGARFDDIVRHGLAHGQYPDLDPETDAWRASRDAFRRDGVRRETMRLPGDRWVESVDRLTQTGETVGFRTDVTDRVRQARSLEAARAAAETALAELRAYTSALDRHAILAVTDMERRFIRVNDLFCAATGYARADLLGSPCASLNAPGADHAAAHAAIAEGRSWRGELNCRRADGAPLVFDALMMPVRAEDGSVREIVQLLTDVTERHARETEARRLAQRFQAMFDNTLSPVQFRDRNGRTVAANAAFVAACGEAYAGSCDLRDVLAPESAERLLAGDAEIFRTGQPQVAETQLRLKTGETRAFISAKFLIPDFETGESLICAMSNDITELRRREAEAARERDRFERIFHNAPVVMFIKRQDGTLLMGNGPLLEAVGLDSIDGLRDVDIHGDDGAGPLKAHDRQVFETGAPFVGEEIVRGRHFWVSKFLLPDPDPDASEPTLCGISVDITDLRRREIEIERMKERFEAIFRNTDALMFLKRRDGAFIAANPRYLAAAGMADMTGLRDEDINDPASMDEIHAVERRVFETGAPFMGEERLVRESGEVRHYLASKFLVPDPALGEDVLCAIATDITELKRLQASLEESRRAAEAATEAKSQFLATMSHEIRTPLNGVIGMTDLLSRTALGPEQTQMLDIIRESGETLLHVINDILDYSKIEAGGVTLDIEAFSLTELAARTERAHAERARAGGVTLSVSAGASARRRRLGDRHRIAQVLDNLVSNAIKFAPKGHVTLTIEAGEKDLVSFCVRDDGIGMTADEADRVFERFAQADASTTRRFGGTGLGLAIVKGLVDSMGGTVGLETAPGEGSTFTVRLPLPTAAPMAGLCGPGAAAAPAEAERLPGKALIADDNAINRRVLAALLRAIGVDSAVAAGGREAVAMAGAAAYDALLIDISMPDMDGVTALARIREEERRRGAARAPAIAVTAHAGRDRADALLAAGFDLHLPKPVTAAALHAALARVAGAERSARVE